MSKNINVNPGHYKVAGRERQGEDVPQEVNRQAFAEQQAETERWQERQHEKAPGWEQPAQPLAEPEATPAKPKKKPAPAARSKRPVRRSKTAARPKMKMKLKVKLKGKTAKVKAKAARRLAR